MHETAGSSVPRAVLNLETPKCQALIDHWYCKEQRGKKGSTPSHSLSKKTTLAQLPWDHSRCTVLSTPSATIISAQVMDTVPTTHSVLREFHFPQDLAVSKTPDSQFLVLKPSRFPDMHLVQRIVPQVSSAAPPLHQNPPCVGQFENFASVSQILSKAFHSISIEALFSRGL